MNGAHVLIRTLVSSGVDVCFSNPGTSEMHFVAALDDVPEMRGVLGLFEGVVTGAADGYGRVSGRPAATLLHLGPGLGNGVANLHNARRARTPVVNVVGEHATTHRALDAPLASDIESLARPVSRWVRTPARPDAVAGDAAEAVAASYGPPGGVATLVFPADLAWSEAGSPAMRRPPPSPRAPDPDTVERVGKALTSGEGAALLLGGTATRSRALRVAARVAAATGAKLLCETFPALLERGAGLPEPERLGYFGEMVETQLQGVRQLVLVDARAPVAFFAYPGRRGWLVPEGCEIHVLADELDDAPGALEALADAVTGRGGGHGDAGSLLAVSPVRPARPAGALTAQSVAAAIGASLPEDAIVSDEANTAGIFLPAATAGAPPHRWMTLTGGAIGQGLPLATGAAIACPGQRVLCLEADGSAMYTLQALWTQAREGLDVTTLIFDNGTYAILELELARVGAAGARQRARAMLDIGHPPLDFVALARGLGVPASRVTTAEELTRALERSLAEPGPCVIDAVLAPG